MVIWSLNRKKLNDIETFKKGKNLKLHSKTLQDKHLLVPKVPLPYISVQFTLPLPNNLFTWNCFTPFFIVGIVFKYRIFNLKHGVK